MISSYESLRAAAMVTPSLNGVRKKLFSVIPLLKDPELRIRIMQDLVQAAKKEGAR